MQNFIEKSTANPLCFCFALNMGHGLPPGVKRRKGRIMENVIIETIVSITANLAVTLIGVLGAWLLMQISKSQKLSTINTAVGELTTAAEQTVLELQQTVVDDLKAAHADGKLTKEEIAVLGKKLLRGTMKKMSSSSIDVLKAANVDINAIVTGAGEALIAKMKAE